MAEFVTSWKTNSAVIWDAYTGALLIGPLMHDGFVWAAEFSSDGHRILTTSHDGMARIWDAATGRLLAQPLNNGGPLWLARFSPDGQRVLTVCNDMTIQFWAASTGRALTGPLNYGREDELRVYETWIGDYRKERTAQFSPDGQMVVMAFGGKALLLDATTGRPLAEPLRHELVRSAEFSSDSRMIVTASLDGTARVWGIRIGNNQRWTTTRGNQATDFSPVPGWVPKLLEALAEKRLNDEGVAEPVQRGQLQNFRTQLSRSPGSDIWARWGKWLFTGDIVRTNSVR